MARTSQPDRNRRVRQLAERQVVPPASGSKVFRLLILAVGTSVAIALPLGLFLGPKPDSQPAAEIAPSTASRPVQGAGAEPAASELAQRVAELPAARPLVVASDGYVSSQSCNECHPSQHKSWHASYHRTMTQVASPESVIGRFDGTQVRAGDMLASFHRAGDVFLARVTSNEGERTGRVVLTTGSHHMQVCWVSTGNDRELALLPFVYLTDDQRWVPRQSAFLEPPGSRPDFEVGRWNYACIKCHSTHGVPGIVDGRVQTTVADFGISCEACHGPAEKHVHYHRGLGGAAESAALIQPQDLPHDRSSQICGQCHSKFIPREDRITEAEFVSAGFPYRPGDDLLATQRIEPDPSDLGHFWPDGMIRVAGRDYHALKGSPCYVRGDLSCLSCHTLHKSDDDPRSLRQWANDQLGIDKDGNQACLQCHAEFETQERLVAHTHHSAGSSGSLCYNCHMPHTTYGLLKAIRSHQIDSPSAATSTQFGRPNACNLCHLDKSLGWTAGQLQAWYGIEPPLLNDAERTTSAAVGWMLSGDPVQRAVVAWHLGWEPAQAASGHEWLPPFLAQLLTDPYDAVRYISARSLRKLPGFGATLADYDYVGDPAGRLQMAVACTEQWRNAPKPSFPFHDAILLEPSGELRLDAWRQLMESRPKTPIEIHE